MKSRTVFFLIVLAFIISIFSGAISWPFQFVCILLTFHVIGYVLLQRKNNKLYFFFLLLLPFPLLYGTVAFIHGNIPTYPIAFAPFIGFLTAWFLIKIKLKQQKRGLVLSSFILGTIGYFFIMNWLFYDHRDVFYAIKDFPHDIKIKNQNGKEVVLKEDKIYVVDVWSNSCGNCIRQFPKFEALERGYKSDTLVNFIYLNLPVRNSGKEQLKKMKRLNPESYYTSNFEAWDKFGNSVPKYLVVGKDLKIHYQGPFKNKWFFWDTMDDMIQRLK